MSKNTSDIVAKATRLDAIQVSSITEYTHSTPFVQVNEYTRLQIANAILACASKKEDYQHNAVFIKEKTEHYTSSYMYVSDEQLCEMLAVIIMQDIIPAYAQSKLFIKRDRDDDLSDEMKEWYASRDKKYVAEKTTELIEAFNRGLLAYNQSQIIDDEKKATGKTTDIQ